MRSRREFIQLASISAMIFASRPWNTLAAKQQLKIEDLLKFDSKGQLRAPTVVNFNPAHGSRGSGIDDVLQVLQQP